MILLISSLMRLVNLSLSRKESLITHLDLRGGLLVKLRE